MRKFDAVIFDMDGLMVDTERIMKEQIKEILKEMGFPATEQSILKLIGLTDSRTKEVLEKGDIEEIKKTTDDLAKVSSGIFQKLYASAAQSESGQEQQGGGNDDNIDFDVKDAK